MSTPIVIIKAASVGLRRMRAAEEATGRTVWHLVSFPCSRYLDCVLLSRRVTVAAATPAKATSRRWRVARMCCARLRHKNTSNDRRWASARARRRRTLS